MCPVSLTATHREGSTFIPAYFICLIYYDFFFFFCISIISPQVTISNFSLGGGGGGKRSVANVLVNANMAG